MVFRVRDKSLFWTKGGWKNNYAPKVLIMPRATNVTDTCFIIARRDHQSFLRSTNSSYFSGAIL